MKPRNVIVWILLLVIVVLAMSAGVQAQELREVPASEILKKIQAGEDVNYANVRVTGELDLSKIELETVPTAREEWQIEYWGVEEELKIVESKITIINSVFGNTTDFSNAQFKKPVDFHGFPGTSSLGISDFRGASFDGDAIFNSAEFNNVILSDTTFTKVSLHRIDWDQYQFGAQKINPKIPVTLVGIRDAQ